MWDFYWDWGWVISGILLFALGHLVGWVRRGEKYDRELRKENLRIAIGVKK